MKKITFVILLIISFFIMSDVMADTTYIKGTINAGKNTNVYSNPSTSSSVLRNDTGYIINLNYPETFEILSEENGFYKIYFQYSSFYHTGYILIDNASKETFNIEDTTVNNMRDLGFDDTYAYKLAVLKTINSKWVFEPYNTNLDWNYAVDQEASVIDRNLISGSNTALRSTDDAAYNGNGVWEPFDSGKWYAASKQTIKYFMDPRNFFNEGHVFMFEKLSYDDKIDYTATVNSVLKGTFMASNDAFYCSVESLKKPCSETSAVKNNISYTEVFNEAGYIKKVSPIHLATRVKQEHGSSGSVLSSGEGWQNQYVGYYNFFNINAFGDGEDVIIKNGLSHAEENKWDSPYASIVEGASFIAKSYIGKGQDTLYFQKFDVVHPASFNHQYMQNIRAPYSESYGIYSSYYNNDVISNDFVFKIPVYNNMPAFTSLSSDGNEDATLKYLNIPGCYLMPTFTPSALNYNCSVNKDVASVNVSAEATNTNAVVSGIGNVNLTTDSTTINVVVTAAAGNTRTYNIVIKKIETSQFTPDEIISRLGININSKFLSGNNIMTTPDNLITLIKSNFSTATVSLNNKKIGTGTTLTITNNGSKTYNLVIYGDNTGDGVIDILDLLTIQKHLLNSAKISDSYLKASDVNKDGKVDILDLLTIQKYILGTGNISQ